MAGPCKVIPGSPCDELRAHLPHSANKDPPPLERGEARYAASRYQGRLIISLPRGKFSDAKVPHLWDRQGTLLTRKALKNLHSLLNLIPFSTALNQEASLLGELSWARIEPGASVLHCPVLLILTGVSRHSPEAGQRRLLREKQEKM